MYIFPHCIPSFYPSWCPFPALRHSPSRRRGASLRVMRPMSQTDPDHAAEPHEGQEGSYYLLSNHINWRLSRRPGSLLPPGWTECFTVITVKKHSLANTLPLCQYMKFFFYLTGYRNRHGLAFEVKMKT